MGRDPRHSVLDSSVRQGADAPGSLAIHIQLRGRGPDLATRLQLAVANSRLHRPIRVALDAARTQRREPRAVANQRDRAPVGERLAAHPFVAVFGDSGVADQQARDGLVGLDDSRLVRSLKGSGRGPKPEGLTSDPRTGSPQGRMAGVASRPDNLVEA